MTEKNKSNIPRSPSRPSLARMQEVKSAAAKRTPKAKKSTSKGGAAKKSMPKMVGRKSATAPSRPSLAKMKQIKASATGRPAAKKKPQRHRSASGSAARINIAGRHVPRAQRYKTGYWRPVRQSWMSDEVWSAFKALNRFRNKAMSKGLGRASMGKQIFGKEGPGHPGYGTGHLQKWADKMLRQGEDPHMVDMTKWFAGVAAAFDYHNGDKNFDKLLKAQSKDPDHFMRYVLERLQRYVPQVKKLSKTSVKEIMRHRYYTAQYGPDGRAK